MRKKRSSTRQRRRGSFDQQARFNSLGAARRYTRYHQVRSLDEARAYARARREELVAAERMKLLAELDLGRHAFHAEPIRRKRRLKDFTPSIVAMRTLTPSPVRKALAKANIIPSPRQLIRRGLLADVTLRQREQIHDRLRRCHDAKSARRHRFFQSRGGSGGRRTYRELERRHGC